MIDAAGIMLTATMVGVSGRQIGLSRGVGLVLGIMNACLSIGLLVLFRDMSDFPNKSADLGQTLTACLISGAVFGSLVWTLRPLTLPKNR
jgi:tellurite resistance protein TehA-like permease